MIYKPKAKMLEKLKAYQKKKEKKNIQENKEVKK